MAIFLSERNLKKRALDIKSLLEPIGGSRIAAHQIEPTPNSITFGVLNGSKTTSASKDWIFKTRNEDLVGNYREKWNRKENNYSLCFVYLTIHDKESKKEILALHCDPEEPINSKYFKYKCGPHMHVAGTRISDAHIALNLSNHSEVISSYDSLTKALKDAIQMISDEMI